MPRGAFGERRGFGECVRLCVCAHACVGGSRGGDVDTRTRKQEIEALSGPNEFSEFYRRLKAIKDFHRQFPNEVVDPMDAEFHALTQDRDATVERTPEPGATQDRDAVHA